MRNATAFLAAEMDRVGALVAALKVQRAALRQTRSYIERRIAEIETRASSDATARRLFTTSLARLFIEDEQTAEHVRLIDDHLAEREKQLDDLADDLAMIQDRLIV
jgi:septal ring factor EnvC (AmiA/AmiB activator)